MMITVVGSVIRQCPAAMQLLKQADAVDALELLRRPTALQSGGSHFRVAVAAVVAAVAVTGSLPSTPLLSAFSLQLPVQPGE